MRKKWIAVIAGLFLFTTLAFREDLFQVSKNLDIFTSLYKEISINYVDDLNSSNLMKTGIDAMLESLDPYTEFVPESEIEDYRMKYVSTQYGGIGATVAHRDGKVFIAEPYAGYPADKAGLRAGDQILEINGVAISGKSNEQASQLLKGPKGTSVSLKVLKYGEKLPIQLSLQRAEILQPNVTYHTILENNTGYIRLDKFLENSSDEVKKALTDLKGKGVQSIILDLRNNGGGILQEAVKIVNLFVPKNIIVVTQKSKNHSKTITYNTLDNAVDSYIPLVILINSRSASASEIVAGTLQDLDRAVIIGQRSYGKGLVQQTFNLPYNSLVKVTVAKYYTASGRCIQARNFSERDKEGHVVRIPDSLITEFKTKAGRLVYDGSAIYPDLYVQPRRYHSITQALVTQYHIFDFANKYKKEKPSIIDAKNFALTDTEYTSFVQFLNGRRIDYTSKSEKLLSEISSEAEKEYILEALKTELTQLKNKLIAEKQNDLNTHKEEIKQVLELEIASRYFFEKGRIENSFRKDIELDQAIKTLQNKTLLTAILNGEANYKVIGRPQKGVAVAQADEEDE